MLRKIGAVQTGGEIPQLGDRIAPVAVVADLSDLWSTVFPVRCVACAQREAPATLPSNFRMTSWIHSKSPGGIVVDRVQIYTTAIRYPRIYAPRPLNPTVPFPIPIPISRIGDIQGPITTEAYWNILNGAMDPAFDSWWELLQQSRNPYSFSWDVPLWVPPNYCLVVGFEPIAGAISFSASFTFREIPETQAIESGASG